ncbi:MAG: hypothetical protein ACRDNS_22055 [Trebonia sp.]
MRDAVIAVAAGSAAPTVVGPLAYANTRAARRHTAETGLARLAGTVETLSGAVTRIESGLERVEHAIGEVRDRIARVEGRLDRQPPATRHRRS